MKKIERILKTLITEQEIKEIVDRLGDEINADYSGVDFYAIGILKGSFIFMADLIRRVKTHVEIDFMCVSSYCGLNSLGTVKITKDVNVSLEGKHILIIEDILDTGLTLEYVKDELLKRNPKSIKICTLLDKPERRKSHIKADYVGKVIPDEFVVGYGLDFDGRYRNLPFIGVYNSNNN